MVTDASIATATPDITAARGACQCTTMENQESATAPL